MEWTAPASQRSRVVAEEEDGDRVTTSWAVGEDEAIEQDMLGLAAATPYRAWVELEDGSNSPVTDFVTEPPPARLPSWTVAGTAGWRGWMLTELLGSGRRAVLLDAKGRITWYSERFASGDPTIRAALRSEGDGVWVLGASTVEPAAAYLRAYGWDSIELLEYHVPGWTHDFVVLASGEFVWLEDDCRLLDSGETVCGERVMRGSPADLPAAQELWSVFENFDPETDGVVDGSDWTHANALDVDEAAGRVSVGLRGLSAIVQLDLETGAVLRQIGGPHSDYVPANADSTIDGQHQFEFFGENSAIIYDNRPTGANSRVVTMEFDDGAGTMTAVSEIQPDPRVRGAYLGDVDRFGAGTLVTWSAAGILAKYGTDDANDWSLSSDLGNAFGYTKRITELPGMTDVE
ncbi:MAG: hypothetical protein EXR71_15920 [Myxococcales bacterium]|nr:hypothetical protein [Myxococcales bacterium]